MFIIVYLHMSCLCFSSSPHLELRCQLDTGGVLQHLNGFRLSASEWLQKKRALEAWNFSWLVLICTYNLDPIIGPGISKPISEMALLCCWISFWASSLLVFFFDPHEQQAVKVDTFKVSTTQSACWETIIRRTVFLHLSQNKKRNPQKNKATMYF